MAAADGTVIGATKLVDHGPDGNRFVFAVLAEGFRADQQAAFETAASAFVAALQAMKPFDDLWSQINIYRVDIHSVESGADNPATCGSSGPPVGGATAARTFLDARYCGDGSIRRLLVVDQALALTTANAQVPNYDIVVVIVNHLEYGGSGANKVAVYSLAPNALEIAIHELGHSAFNLADEYEYFAGCASGEAGHDTYTGAEPGEPNVTTVTNRANLKWRHLVDGATRIPTTTNPDCTKCPPAGSPVPAGTIGLFVGARYFHCGLYRPADDCLMRTVGAGLPFCKVCREAISKVIVADAEAASRCFVAGAVYGDPSHPDVLLLRRWRDRHLTDGAVGRATMMRTLVACYGRVGPPLARFAAARPRLAGALRWFVFGPAVALLRRLVGDLPPPPEA
jgi:IgA Peptidase M64